MSIDPNKPAPPLAPQEGPAKIADAVEGVGDQPHDVAPDAGETPKRAGKHLRGILRRTVRDSKNTIIN